MPWDRVHEEAEALEHVISEDLEARIAAKLGNPTHDPHGDPIPSADLAIEETTRPRSRASTSARAGGSSASPTPTPRCSATSTSAASGSATTSRCVERQPFGGPLTVVIGGARQVLGGALARAMRVEVG